jgi:hypothetical protein
VIELCVPDPAVNEEAQEPIADTNLALQVKNFIGAVAKDYTFAAQGSLIPFV